MRVAPLGAYFADDIDTLISEAAASAAPTHAHDEAVAGAIAVAVASAFAWRNRSGAGRADANDLLLFAHAHTPPGETRRGIATAIDLGREASVTLAASVLARACSSPRRTRFPSVCGAPTVTSRTTRRALDSRRGPRRPGHDVRDRRGIVALHVGSVLRYGSRRANRSGGDAGGLEPGQILAIATLPTGRRGMPIEIGVWKLGKKIEQLRVSSLERESELEDALVADLGMLGPGLLLFGRQSRPITGSSSTSWRSTTRGRSTSSS